MVGWHHRLSGHEFEQTQGDGEGQGRLACCSPSGREELDMTWSVNSLSWLMVGVRKEALKPADCGQSISGGGCKWFSQHQACDAG